MHDVYIPCNSALPPWAEIMFLNKYFFKSNHIFTLSEKYPQIKRLMGYDTNIANIMLAMVLVQVITSYLLRNESWMTIVIVGYCFGGVVNHSMTLALHEVGHNLAYGHAKPMWNRIIGFIGNLVIGVPISVSFKRYHQDHHKYQVKIIHTSTYNTLNCAVSDNLTEQIGLGVQFEMPCMC